MSKEQSMSGKHKISKSVIKDKGVTVVRVTHTSPSGRQVVADGIARRSLEDMPNDAIGEDLAFGRALSKLGSQLKKDAWNRVKKSEAKQREFEERRAQAKAEADKKVKKMKKKNKGLELL